MLIAHTISDLRDALASYRHPSFVPTMGNLHDGHMALIEQAQSLGDVLVTSIFVNRLQFLPHEDFDSYPRTWEADCKRLQDAGCQVLFAPKEEDLYPVAQTFRVQPDPVLADILEGSFRPGFFTGVCTVVMKLFACVFGKTGGTAVFGQKDYQQLLIIKKMVEQFALPIDIVSGATRRAADGLALSSRNRYLSLEERQEAVALSEALQHLSEHWLKAYATASSASAVDTALLEHRAMDTLRARGWQPDYLTVRRRSDLQPPALHTEDDHPQGPGHLVALGAARLGGTRLIDNREF